MALSTHVRMCFAAINRIAKHMFSVVHCYMHAIVVILGIHLWSILYSHAPEIVHGNNVIVVFSMLHMPSYVNIIQFFLHCFKCFTAAHWTIVDKCCRIEMNHYRDFSDFLHCDEYRREIVVILSSY